MATQSTEADFIAARVAKLAAAYNNRDIDTALTMYVEEGLSYSDYGVMALNMDKSALAAFLAAMFATCKTIRIETIAVSGTKAFTAWEWKMRFVKNEGLSEFEEINRRKTKEGEELVFLGVSLSWWSEDVEGRDGRILKNCDYARLV